MVALEDVFVHLAERVGRSVVSVHVSRRLVQEYARESGPPASRGDRDRGKPIHQALDQTIASAGSGMVIRADGLILTNEHVISGADEITVLLSDGSAWTAELVGADVRSDLAVIRIERGQMTPVEWAELAQVRRGQWAFAMGDPYGYAGDGQVALSVGHVSALGRELQRQLDPTNVRYYGNLIQTTAGIHPGNSGGPLLNLRGQVIGINTAIQSRNGSGEGVGFAIPITRRTLAVIEALSRGERVSYGYLGVRVGRPELFEPRPGSDIDREQEGAVILEVLRGSPAAASGLRRGDVILMYDEERVEDPDHLVRRVGMSPPGSTVDILVRRDLKRITVPVQVTERAVPDPRAPIPQHEPPPRFDPNVA